MKRLKSVRANWTRIPTLPNAIVDQIEKIDPNNAQDFVNKTRNKKVTLGDLFDRSSELSELRMQQNGGVDKIAEKHEASKAAERVAKKARNRAAKQQRQQQANKKAQS